MTLTTLERKLKPYEDPIKNSVSRWLYVHFPPRPISSKKMFAHYKAAVEILMHEIALNEGKISTAVIKEYLIAVVPFVEDYEKKTFKIESSTPEEVLQFLMEQNDLSQYDIAEEVGGQSVVSDILNGKRKLTRDHIEKLSQRFKITPATFFGSSS